MNQSSEILSQSEIEAQKRREAREKSLSENGQPRNAARHSVRDARLRVAKARLALWTNGTCATNATNTDASEVRFGAASASTAVVNMQIDAGKQSEIQSTAFEQTEPSKRNSESGELQHPHGSDLFGSVMGPITQAKMRARPTIKVRIAIT
jgi:hypothetical protein